MVEFADARKSCDHRDIADRRARGGDARFKVGEFAATGDQSGGEDVEVCAQRVLAMTGGCRRSARMRGTRGLRATSIRNGWCGSIGRCGGLVHESSKQLLNALVVQVAVHQTPELLGRWLNQFIARVEPEEQMSGLRRSMEDRYASVRPDIDGMSFLSALMSAVDAAAIDRILAALAAAAPPGDTRTMAQRRSDALVDMLCGRISNGCHVRWDTNDDGDDHLDNTDHDEAPGSHRPTAPSNSSPKDSVPRPVDDQPNATPQPGDPPSQENRRPEDG